MLFARHRLTVENLSCTRGLATVFEGVGFAVGPGEMVALRGPNGAGKSTLLRALAGLAALTAGRVAFEPRADADEIGRAAHYIGHSPGITLALTTLENLRYQIAVLSAPKGTAAEDCLERVGLSPFRQTAARQLSAGQRKRLALARLLAAPRPLWLLDEPAESLDSAGRALLGEMIDSHLLAGGIAVVASHEPVARATFELTLKPAA